MGPHAALYSFIKYFHISISVEPPKQGAWYHYAHSAVESQARPQDVSTSALLTFWTEEFFASLCAEVWSSIPELNPQNASSIPP